jgi:hypothetical protein
MSDKTFWRIISGWTFLRFFFCVVEVVCLKDGIKSNTDITLTVDAITGG